uniref:Uncharacterized protein n=1 Tax=Knipowitschia caucasica TaxID=637954 RepID=A0AAV2MHE8_KNICA
MTLQALPPAPSVGSKTPPPPNPFTRPLPLLTPGPGRTTRSRQTHASTSQVRPPRPTPALTPAEPLPFPQHPSAQPTPSRALSRHAGSNDLSQADRTALPYRGPKQSHRPLTSRDIPTRLAPSPPANHRTHPSDYSQKSHTGLHSYPTTPPTDTPPNSAPKLHHHLNSDRLPTHLTHPPGPVPYCPPHEPPLTPPHPVPGHQRRRQPSTHPRTGAPPPPNPSTSQILSPHKPLQNRANAHASPTPRIEAPTPHLPRRPHLFPRNHLNRDPPRQHSRQREAYESRTHNATPLAHNSPPATHPSPAPLHTHPYPNPLAPSHPAFHGVRGGGGGGGGSTTANRRTHTPPPNAPPTQPPTPPNPYTPVTLPQASQAPHIPILQAFTCNSPQPTPPHTEHLVSRHHSTDPETTRSVKSLTPRLNGPGRNPHATRPHFPLDRQRDATPSPPRSRPPSAVVPPERRNSGALTSHRLPTTPRPHSDAESIRIRTPLPDMTPPQLLTRQYQLHRHRSSRSKDTPHTFHPPRSPLRTSATSLKNRTNDSPPPNTPHASTSDTAPRSTLMRTRSHPRCRFGQQQTPNVTANLQLFLHASHSPTTPSRCSIVRTSLPASHAPHSNPRRSLSDSSYPNHPYTISLTPHIVPPPPQSEQPNTEINSPPASTCPELHPAITISTANADPQAPPTAGEIRAPPKSAPTTTHSGGLWLATQSQTGHGIPYLIGPGHPDKLLEHPATHNRPRSPHPKIPSTPSTSEHAPIHSLKPLPSYTHTRNNAMPAAPTLFLDPHTRSTRNATTQDSESNGHLKQTRQPKPASTPKQAQKRRHPPHHHAPSVPRALPLPKTAQQSNRINT